MDWISEDSLAPLEEAMDIAHEYNKKMQAFRTGLLPKELRPFQLAAHQAYDRFSSREIEVFMMRLKNHSFPLIASQIGVSVSSAKTYWRRCLAKCNDLFQDVALTDIGDEKNRL